MKRKQNILTYRLEEPDWNLKNEKKEGVRVLETVDEIDKNEIENKIYLPTALENQTETLRIKKERS